MKHWGVPNWLAITLSIVIMVVIFLLLTWLIRSQINTMAQDWPTIKKKATEKLNILSEWANQRLNWDYKDYIDNNKRLVDKMESVAGVVLSSLMNVLSQSLIIFVYIILLLMQKRRFINFFKKMSFNAAAMTSLLSDASNSISSYLFGKSKIMLFLFGFYYLGFMLASVPYAVFWLCLQRFFLSFPMLEIL
ncbi:uncharacterized protein DUF20 [Gelidibacter algens]|uniref:Uncharacterized protein DUF20 n=1 Tax=Gelidibacter algens TaxID=49280 RepID=A0A327SDL0_9FLAO|nr:AI-2E family transporter [Gelidibacter algens]RAJ26695.1 uncharacterized protein DUF20 [Gelidibacter algens]